jgi:putative phosphoribosyl transferase
MLYQNRRQAGKLLSIWLSRYSNAGSVIVLALLRGGVPVGYEVARALAVPLDGFIVRKLGTPGEEELAMGAISSGGTCVINEGIVHALGIPDWAVQEEVAREKVELEKRERKFHCGFYAGHLTGKVVVVVDDGLATGASLRAALKAIRRQDPEYIVVAVPVGEPRVCRELETEVDEFCCAATPQPFDSVGKWYTDFSQTTDEEVAFLLDLSKERAGDAA